MNFDDFQKTWQSHNPGASVTINADILLKEVRYNQQQFWATIFWRDVREVGVALLLTAFFLYAGIRHRDWTNDLLALAACGVGTFMVVDRLIQRKKQPVKNDSLKVCAESSLQQVIHQIWLLKNVFWWYLLPFAVALEIFFCSRAWHSRHNPVMMACHLFAPTLIVVLLYWGIYWLNQFAVRKILEPRRKNLESLLASLDNQKL